MLKNFKIGFIGAGGQALEQIESVNDSKLGKVAAVCDLDLEKVHILREKYNIPIFTCYQQMIQSVQLDAVFICLPHNAHFSATMFALKNGLHVIKEKPFALTVQEGQALVEESRKQKKALFTVMQRRHHSSYLVGKDWMSEIGTPYLYRGSYTFNGSPYDFGWRGIKEIAGGGAVLDMGYHIVDLIIWYLGIPTEVYAQLLNVARPDTHYETEDSAILTFGIRENLMGNLVLARASHPKGEQTYIHGTNGTLFVNRSQALLYDLEGNVRRKIDVQPSWSEDVIKQIDDIIEKILSGELEDGSSHLPHLYFVDAAYRSHLLGEPVRVYTNPFWITKRARGVL